MMGEDDRSLFRTWLAAYENRLSRMAHRDRAEEGKLPCHPLDSDVQPDSAAPAEAERRTTGCAGPMV